MGSSRTRIGMSIGRCVTRIRITRTSITSMSTDVLSGVRRQGRDRSDSGWLRAWAF
jgi:hypothetical protein